MQLLFPVNKKEINRIIKMSLTEDIGVGDITSNMLIKNNITAKMSFVAREQAIIAGIPLIKMIFSELNSNVRVDENRKDGDKINTGDIICTIEGNAKEILLAERTCLNLMQHMSGIATLTAEFVNKTEGTIAKILDTRKTTPGLREIEKYAVRVGGGKNHRMRLDDRILVKDNHLNILAEQEQKNIANVAEICINKCPKDIKIEIECDTFEQVKEIIDKNIDYILLDNMALSDLKKSVILRNSYNKNIKLEASGGVNIETVKPIAQTGVDYISVGAITHSTKNIDIGLDQI